MAHAWLDRDYLTSGGIELMRDSDNDDTWWLLVDNVVQSIVDLSDPTHLDLEYVQRISYVIDHLPAGRLDAVHVGAGACTIPRYIEAKRPGSAQLVIDPDKEIVGLVREHLRLDEVEGLSLELVSGEVGVADRAADSADLVVLDAFCGFVVPDQLVTVDFFTDVARVLRPGGVLAVNVADGDDFEFAERVCATVRKVFPHRLLLGEADVIARTRFGNIVIGASEAPLPVGYIRRRAAAAAAPARCLGEVGFDAFVNDAASFE